MYSFPSPEVALRKPLIPFFCFLYLLSSSGLMPEGHTKLPSASATPIKMAPYSVKNFEAQYPTLPKPCTINLFPFNPL